MSENKRKIVNFDWFKNFSITKIKERSKARKEKRIKEQKEYEKRLINYNRIVVQEIASRKEEKIAPEGSFISIKNLDKIYDNLVQAVFDFSLDINKNEFIVFVGPSGCGKSTTLRMIAGLEEITHGDLFIDGVYANSLAPKDRNIAMVFQTYALYPHYTVRENLEFSLKIAKLSREEIDERVNNAVKILQLEDYLDRKPKALSGGQRQRVALGRAIVRKPKVFLMDEPLSNLDAKLRVSMRSEIIKLHKTLNATTIYVTHDQTEAMTMADRIVIMKDGYIQQIGTPEEIYSHPVNLFVATFIGSPAMNIVNAKYNKGVLSFENGDELHLEDDKITKINDYINDKILSINNELNTGLEKDLETELLVKKYDFEASFKAKKGVVLEDELAKINLTEEEVAEITELYNEKMASTIENEKYYENILKEEVFDVKFGIRPEDCYISGINFDENVKISNNFNVKIAICELLGSEYHIHSEFGSQDLIFKMKANRNVKENENVKVVFDLNKIHLFDVKTTNNII